MPNLSSVENTKVGQFNIISQPEIFIGLVGPLGADLSSVIKEIKTSFSRFGYKIITIKLSECIDGMQSNLETKLESTPEDKRISSYMSAGTEFRDKLAWGGALAIMAAAKVRESREEPTKPRHKTLYIFNSLKHKKETEVFRNIYGNGYFQISVYSSEENRTAVLAEKIAKSNCSSFRASDYISTAQSLIKRDYDENHKLGQNVSGAFPLADFFVNIDLRHEYKNKVIRFVDLLFGNPFITPTKEEAGMFYARTAALRSSDLSRQVGAAITNKNGDVINVGCNDVPKAGGGVFWEGDDPKEDFRDVSIGYDINTKKKEELLVQTIKLLQDIGIAKKKGQAADKIASNLLYGDYSEQFKDSQIANLLEYGRVVHAEMHAITDSAMRGLSVKNATLYSTTFPCHMCARHIISSGIDEVVYIEPYPKSLAEDLYKNELSVDKQEVNKVNFRAFMGVSPLSYMKLFNYKKRKDRQGKKVEWPREEQEPIVIRYVPSYIMIEEDVVENLYKKFLEIGFLKEAPDSKRG